MKVRPVIWVGIDAGKTIHHACAMDSEGKVVFSQKVTNDQTAIEQLIARANKTATEVRWAVDLTSNAAALLLAVLVTAGQRVAYVPGRVVNRMTGVFRGEAKSDAKDARIIAETARMRSDLTELSTPDELVVELTRLTAHREDLMADWVRGVNRLRDLLTSIFPALERAFDYSTRSALILVAGYQTPDAVRAAGEHGLTRHLLDHSAWAKGTPSMVDKTLAAAASQTVRLPGETTTAVLIARLARQLLDLDREIKDTDKLIKDRFRAHPQAEIIESLPGLGPILGAEFIVATGGDLAAFANSGRLASYAGLVPVPQDSGRVTGNLRRPKRYNRKLRRVFYMAALSSIRANGPSRTFYDKKRGERLIHTQALLALARRLVDVLWALLRDGRTFTPTAPPPATTAA
ncbi:Transposase IS116/IS110/IS902 family protein [Saccharopolyspora antimicrobica]|uniref:Transposase n=1 Tax=Saccharopolyspora antimicrobica TaxID=455193 RepID=A0A1I5JTX1_9PSEU|nr:IS110 family transposase [Saccharopolyspora antimicrobica]RKT86918.1 transposase [Saccharopolyspora antimicrobica]RKT89147.1 transposase [Saccharopolyspora antimicrobica]SFO75861.1 Transposase IS116/IS110/IS902 family protein [Saccharopolyspora antimicrobica]SFO91475.1 Transposase IS116/IS110/IS902 family protein [Saccharopolyspora antimicrobica]